MSDCDADEVREREGGSKKVKQTNPNFFKNKEQKNKR